MWIIPESQIADLMSQGACNEAVEAVFAAMARGDARNFPVVREAIGHEDALYGFKGGFDRAGSTLGLKAGGYWPNNLEKHGEINHQSTVFLFDPDTGKPKAMVGGNLLTALRTAAASSVSIATASVLPDPLAKVSTGPVGRARSGMNVVRSAITASTRNPVMKLTKSSQ